MFSKTMIAADALQAEDIAMKLNSKSGTTLAAAAAPLLLAGASMSKFLQNTRMNDLRLSALFGSMALIALMSATPVAPAHAQGVPAGLLRLDPPQPSNDAKKLTEDQCAKVRGASAHNRKTQAHQ